MKNSENLQPLYNSRIIDIYLKLLKKQYPAVDTGELLRRADIKPYEAADKKHWFTQEQIDLFYNRLVQVTNNDNIAREAGRFFTAPEVMNAMQQYILGMLGPTRAFEIVQKSSANFTRSAVYTSHKLANNQVEVTVTPKPGVAERLFQCQNRVGFLEALPILFTRKVPQVKHPECIFEGADCCRYTITWDKSPTIILQQLRNLAAIILVTGCLVTAAFSPWSALTVALPITFSITAILTLTSWWFERRESLKSLHSLWSSADKLLDQLKINYNNTQLSNEIGHAISSQTTVDSILQSVIQALEKRLDYDRGMILLANADKDRLVFKASFGYHSEGLNVLESASFNLDDPDSKGVFVVSFREQKPFLINDINDIKADLSARSLAFARRFGTQSFICAPIICDGEAIGILAVDNKQSKKPLVQSDMNLLMGIAPVIGVSIRNADLLARQEEVFHSVLQVLSASTDARDPLTAGHSEKVTEYSLGICQQLELSQDFTEMIRVAALLHDYGKIGIPDSILKKNGRLSPEEYEVVKTHARKTQEILSQIKFHGIYTEVPTVACSHHEKLDGSGYPNGLSGDEIPFGARIIAVADYFEAVTSMRHYRSPMPVNEAYALLRNAAGALFDEKIVEALITYYTEHHQSQEDSAEYCLLNRQPRRTRIPFHVAVSFVYAGERHDASTTDLSSLGLYLNYNKPIATEELVDLEFSLPDITIQTQARVAWANPATLRSKARYPAGFGVEFLSIHSYEQQAIFDHVASRVGHA